jgi:sorbitol-specific phosphotransferase system component IIBC
VRDSEISRAKMLKTLMAAHVGINEEEAKEKYKAIILETKQKYIGQAQTNKEQLNGLRNFIAPRLGHVVAFLYEKDSSTFEEQMSQD